MTLYMQRVSNLKQNEIYCALWIEKENKDIYYAHLKSQSSAMEAELGRHLDWQLKPGQESRSVLLKERFNLADATNREKVIAWLDEDAIPFFNALRWRLDEMAVTLSTPKP